MKKSILIVCLAVVVAAGFPAVCAGELIAFDDVGFTGDWGPFSGDQFRSVGAMFRWDDSPTPFFAKDGWGGHAAFSPPYVTIFGPSGAEPIWTRSLRVDFVVSGTNIPGVVTAVSAWVGDASDESETIVLTGYRDDASPVDTDSFTTGFQSGNARSLGQVSVSGSDIAYVVFSSTHAVSMDDLTFDEPTPEPTTLSLLTLGGLAMLRRRKRGACK